jgi:hypothetical protein
MLRPRQVAARIPNPLHPHCQCRAAVAQWLGCAPFAHALSIVLACNKHSTLEADPGYPGDGTTDAQEESILDAAWTTLLEQTSRSTDVIHTDVDLECLSVFEQRLFEKSAQSGSAGNYQWGLDAGNHQDGWDPYAGLPSYWNYNDRNKGDADYDENLLEVSCLLTFQTVLADNPISAGQISVSENVAASTNKVLNSSSQHALSCYLRVLYKFAYNDNTIIRRRLLASP